MIEDLPALRGAVPEGGAAGEAIGLFEGVGEQVCVWAEGLEGEAGGAPVGGGGVYGRIFGEVLEDEVAGVAAA